MDRIAFALHSYLSPSQTFIYESLRQIKSFEAIVLTQRTHHLDRFPYPRIFSISDLAPYQRAIENITNYFGRFSSFKKVIRDYQIKLIHAQFAWDGIFMLPLKKHFKIPLITTFRGLDIYGFGNNLVYRMQLKKLFSQGDLFLAVSKKIAEKAVSLGCPENKIMVLYGGIDIEKFKDHPKDLQKKEVNVLMCGRFVEKKGFEYGIRAFAQTYQKHQNLRLKIIGFGPLEEKIRSLVQELGIEKATSMLGKLNHQQVAEALTQTDIFMMGFVTAKNGDREGIPNVLKEAQAVAVPVISTYHAGVPEVVMDGKTGFLVKERDVAALAQRLNYLIENPKLRNELGENGRKFMREKFNVVEQTQKLEELYKKLIYPV
jgi:colanic acid/amylovoran biosynthesis glycosyltransferase